MVLVQIVHCLKRPPSLLTDRKHSSVIWEGPWVEPPTECSDEWLLHQLPRPSLLSLSFATRPIVVTYSCSHLSILVGFTTEASWPSLQANKTSANIHCMNVRGINNSPLNITDCSQILYQNLFTRRSQSLSKHWHSGPPFTQAIHEFLNAITMKFHHAPDKHLPRGIHRAVLNRSSSLIHHELPDRLIRNVC